MFLQKALYKRGTIMKPILKHLLVIQQNNATDLLALSRAITLAEQHQSKLTIFKSFYRKLPHDKFYQAANQAKLTEFLKQQQQLIQQQIANLSDKKLAIDIVFSWLEHEKLAIHRLSQARDITLIIKQQQPRLSWLPSLTPWLEHYLINDIELPVWLVKPNTGDGEKNILACLNLEHQQTSNTAMNHEILNIGSQLNPQDTKPLHVLSCYCPDDISMSFPYDNEQGFKPLSNVAQRHNDLLQQYLERHHLPVEQLHINEGLPDDVIPETALQLHSRLAIIGNYHLHDASSLLLGNTAHYLSQHTPCDVLIVKPQPLASISQF